MGGGGRNRGTARQRRSQEDDAGRGTNGRGPQEDRACRRRGRPHQIFEDRSGSPTVIEKTEESPLFLNENDRLLDVANSTEVSVYGQSPVINQSVIAGGTPFMEHRSPGRTDDVSPPRLPIALERVMLDRERELLRREQDLLNRERILLNEAKGAVSSSCRRVDERALPEFNPSADCGLSAEQWVAKVEENAAIYGWEERELLFFAISKLKGAAKYWYDGSPIPIRSWGVLRQELCRSFPAVVDQIDVHRRLSALFKKKGESYEDYAYKMASIARTGGIDNKSMIRYIIAGLDDRDLIHSLTVQEFRDVPELISRIRHYKSLMDCLNDKQTALRQDKTSLYKASGKKCYVCGQSDHLANRCPVRNIKAKCAESTEAGHRSQQYKEQDAKNKRDQAPIKKHVNLTGENTSFARVPDQNCPWVEARINNKTICALIDTGSSTNLIQNAEFERLGITNVRRDTIPLQGLGAVQILTQGSFTAQVQILNRTFPTTIYIVADGMMAPPMLMGKPLLKNNELVISDGKLIRLNAIENSIFEKDGKDSVTIEVPFSVLQIEEMNDDDLDLSHIQNRKIVKAIIEMKEKYDPIKNRCKDTEIQTRIILKDEEPIAQSPRRLAPREKEEVDKQIKNWLDAGIILPSASEYSSPLVPVKKKNGATRVCVDFRRLNKKVVRDHYPLPNIEDQIDRLQHATIYSTLDLKNGFFHVPVHPDSRKYTAFVTYEGEYEFLRTPFGYCNAPSVFQRFINAAFKPLIQRNVVLVYMDDIVVLARNEEEAMCRLREVFKLAEEYGLEINWQKCQFLMRKILYLGYEVEAGKIRPDKGKVAAMINFPIPKNVKQLQSFLGLAGYFRKFIQDYALIASPLTNLTKNGVPFIMEEKELQAFNILKQKLSEQPILGIYRADAHTELHTDASRMGIGAILLQHDEDQQLHPIYYYSKKTSPAEQNYSSYELEVLAIISALKKFRHYLLGIPFTIITDCSAFQMTMQKQDMSTRIARWALMLEDFDYKVIHRPGSRLQHADALSRNPVMIVSDNLTSKIKAAQEQDEEIVKIIQQVRTGEKNDFQVKNGILYKIVNGDARLFIPEGLQLELIRKAHEAGHFARRKTKALLAKGYWMPKMDEKIERVISCCVPCILATSKSGKREGFLNPINKEGGPLDTIHLDHLGPMEASVKCYRYLLVAIDAFTKFAWLFPTKSTTTRETVAKVRVLQQNFVKPNRFITDRGTAFTGREFRDHCKKENIAHIEITTGVPRGNGQVERLNRIIKASLTKLAIHEPGSWYKFVPLLQRYLNGTYQRSIGTTPFLLMVGVEMKNVEHTNIKEILDEEFRIAFQEDREGLRNDKPRSNF